VRASIPRAADALAAFYGAEQSDKADAGAMLLAGAIDDLRYLRLVAEAWVKGNQEAAKKHRRGR
jgi:hypothetical protein